MATLFTRIIDGDLPGRFVWRDEHCVAFLTIEPLSPGHTLVVPRAEVDHWLDMPAELAAHVFATAQVVARAVQNAFEPTKVGLMVAGLEVPHTHLHVVPIRELRDLDFARADRNAAPEALDEAAERLRGALRELGAAQVAEA